MQDSYVALKRDIPLAGGIEDDLFNIILRNRHLCETLEESKGFRTGPYCGDLGCRAQRWEGNRPALLK